MWYIQDMFPVKLDFLKLICHCPTASALQLEANPSHIQHCQLGVSPIN
jgi:hypothetical protein